MSATGVKISGRGVINGERYTASGKGTGDGRYGKWDFTVAFSTVPREVDPLANLLGILILPTVIFGRADGDAVNLMTLASGVLEFTQILRGDEVAVQSVGTITRAGAGLLWKSEASGRIDIPEVTSIEPFEAVMLPQGHGKITEVFALPFRIGSERRVVQAIRQITFTPRAELKDIQFRRIVITSSVRGRTVDVTTQSIARTVNAPFRITPTATPQTRAKSENGRARKRPKASGQAT